MTASGQPHDDELFARCGQLRRDAAYLLESLTDDQLGRPSLCGEWDVNTVLAHLTVLPSVSRARFGVTALRNLGNLDRTVDSLSRAAARRPAAQNAALLREKAASRAVPPMLGASAPLADLVVHTADARLALGLPWLASARDVAVALAFLASSPVGFVPRSRLRGIKIVPDDLDESWGDGAPLKGAAGDLLLAVCARAPGLDAVHGPGKDLLAERLAA